MDKKIQTHWDKIYETKDRSEVSWTQEIPTTSLDFIHSFKVHKTASIIDVGGGESKLVDYLLDEGFENITFPALGPSRAFAFSSALAEMSRTVIFSKPSSSR